MENRNLNLTVSVGTLIKILTVLGLAALAFYLRDLILIVLTSVVVASAVGPAVRALERFRLPRVLSVLFIYIFAFLVIGGIIYFFVPPIFNDVSDIASTLPRKINNFINTNPAWQTLASFSGSFSKFSIQEVINEGIDQAPLPQDFFGTIKALFNGIFAFALVVVISFYLAVQKNGIENFLRVIAPASVEDYVVGLWKRTETKIGRWMQGQLILGLIIGSLVYLGLALFQIEYALVLAIIAAVFEIIPYFGPTLAAVPAVLLGFAQNPALGLIIVGFYVIIQQFENHLIYPLVVKKVVGINPLLVVISLIVGAKVAGFLGVILAVPAATFLTELISDLEKRKQSVI